MRNKLCLLCFTIILVFFSGICDAKELKLIQGRTYILNFDEEILNFHTSSTSLEGEILHTIFNDKKQMLLSLKSDAGAYLQVKTENNLFNYEIKSANKSSKEVVEIDFPPIEDLNVDIYDGEN